MTRNVTNERLATEMLKRMLEFDIILIESEREEIKMPKNDPRRKEMSLRLTQFSVPFGISKSMLAELKNFFTTLGWELVKITSSPSIKIRKITAV